MRRDRYARRRSIGRRRGRLTGFSPNYRRTNRRSYLTQLPAEQLLGAGLKGADLPPGVLVSEVVQETLCVFCNDEGASLPRTMNESSEDERSRSRERSSLVMTKRRAVSNHESFVEPRRRKHVSEHRERTRATSRGSRAYRGFQTVLYRSSVSSSLTQHRRSLRPGRGRSAFVHSDLDRTTVDTVTSGNRVVDRGSTEFASRVIVGTHGPLAVDTVALESVLRAHGTPPRSTDYWMLLSL